MLLESPSFGVLTLATSRDYLKAIGLSLSLRITNPGVPIAVACSAGISQRLLPYFDHVIQEKEGLRGFVHKVHLDQYTPFKETLFFDSDVLVFRQVRPYVDSWGPFPYRACGHYMVDGRSSFGMDRRAVLKRIGKERMVVIDGAGHAFFRKPECVDVFEQAREVTRRHAEYVGHIPYADEDVMDIVMTIRDLPPAPYTDFFARYLSAKPGTMSMDATVGHCSYISALTGRECNPCMVHFAANEAPLPYGIQLRRLMSRFGAPKDGLLEMIAGDCVRHYVKEPLIRRMKGALKP